MDCVVEPDDLTCEQLSIPIQRFGNSRRGTVGTLIGDYCQSAAFMNLKASSRKAYRIVLDLGAQSLHEIERYTAAADQKRLSRGAIAKLKPGNGV